MRLVFAKPAAQDLTAIIDHIAEADAKAAQAVFQAIFRATQRLRDFPNIGHGGRVPGTRELSVRGFPYVVVYQVKADLITVVAVFHAARDLARLIPARAALE